MTLIISLGVALMMLLTAPVLTLAQDQPALTAEAQALSRQFAQRLQAALAEALQQGGPAQALGVCQAHAPTIAEDLSAASGWRVGRTALRLRNQANGPDAWEAAGLREFQARAQAGEPVAGLVKTEVVEGPQGRVFRYLAAIPTGQACLTCHGESVDPRVQARIGSLYPGDQATGFKVGELRGAFSLAKPLP